ncbi:hypothetical protein ACFFSH_40245 [Streptomyces filamentosus]|uniref:Uncharacterized protein n=1 Tax=Streptomyces filamentosus TaxID=67294 RepID=A0A919BTX8_STRFL|nr:hypothetical protein [Streptomyces filamentosus]GHG15485.1 hypothetical protein GCM10017667_56320 [Streptomyces filamentosus]
MNAREDAVQAFVNGGWSEQIAREIVASVRAEALAERDAQTVSWLGKKAGEFGRSNRENRAASDAVARMADKLSRGAVRDDETGVSELYRLKAENNQLRAQVAEVCGQRDAWHDWADTLAYKVAPVEVLGRHGDEGKFPWDDALKLITPAAEVQRLREERHSTNEALDDAVREAAELRARVAELEAEQVELVARASRVAVSHEHFIQDHSDPGTEALAAQYELINWLARSEHHAGLPLNPVETALRVVLAELDKYDENVTPGELRAVIAKALPREDMSDRRRRIYVDGHGDGWIDQSVTSDGTHWLVQLSSMAAGGSEPALAITKRTGSLREIGRCW